MRQDIKISVLIERDRIMKRVSELAERITKDYQGLDFVMVGVLKGSFLFLSDLCRMIPHAMSVDFLGLSSYGAGTESTGVVKITSDLTIPIADRHVLIVEDIVDTGLTLNYLIENLSTRMPKSIRICTLLYKPSNIIKPVPLDYVGFEIENKFVVGYGLDLAEKHRNLSYIGYIEPEAVK
ncbi:MAG: hypoxanthine phosphoribosyltransferase [Deltaproteobacteria bacterium]|nr:hypoxanthine phosphoribosyltransferase [Deltaproteobacteria bacterium]